MINEHKINLEELNYDTASERDGLVELVYDTLVDNINLDDNQELVAYVFSISVTYTVETTE